MKIVQDAPIAVNAREIKRFGSLTDGTGDGDGWHRCLRRRAFSALSRAVRRRFEPRGGLAQAARAEAVGGAGPRRRQRQAVGLGIAPARSDIVARAAEFPPAAFADQAPFICCEVRLFPFALHMLAITHAITPAQRRLASFASRLRRSGIIDFDLRDAILFIDDMRLIDLSVPAP
jgi:hypothetical protein